VLDRVVKLLISLVYHACRTVCATAGALAGKERSGRFVVLTYHAVKAGQRDRFASQMNALKKYGTAVSAEAASPPDGKDRIAITFDDGFTSVIENALPVMAARGVPATIFVTTGYLGARAGWIAKHEHVNYHEVVLSARQLQELPSNLVCIGSHAVQHRDLSRLTPDEATAELRQSKETLEAILKRPVRLFSLPFGGCSPAVLDLARKAGYQRIFLNVPVYAAAAGEDVVVGRTNTTPDDWDLEFMLKASGAYQWLPRAIEAKRRLLKGCARCIPGRRERSMAA
jgi:peptidoglycan/xylan/chitin deacetylase (PgdA/CDA1 family)